MKGYLGITLGILTAIGGYVDVGAIATAGEAGSIFGFGLIWAYGEEEKKPTDAAIFNLVFLVYIVGGTLLIGLTGVDPLQLTIISVVFAALILPVIVVPFLAVMNDSAYLEDKTNGALSNAVVLLIVLLAFVLSATSIPLTILSGG